MGEVVPLYSVINFKVQYHEKNEFTIVERTMQTVSDFYKLILFFKLNMIPYYDLKFEMKLYD
jgi:hypothetical protein